MQESTITPVLEIRGLSKSLSGRPILRDINITLYPGEIFGFLGPNGSGKTTTIKLMLGLLRIDRGEVRICGHDVKTDFEAALAPVGGIVENPELYGYLSGYENLDLFRRMYDGIPKTRIDEVVALVGLGGRIHDKVSRYSLGMRQRLGLAQALLNHPRLLVLDEPTNGLDPEGIRDLRDLLKRVAREEQVTVFVSSHLLAELEQMCTRVGIIDRGMVVDVRSMEEMHGTAHSPDGRKSYLFLSDAKENLPDLLRANGFETSSDPRGAIVTLLPEEIPSVLRTILDAGVQITGFGEVKRSLEDAFLEITGAAVTAGGRMRDVGMNQNASLPQEEIYTPPAVPEESKEGSSDERNGKATADGRALPRP